MICLKDCHIKSTNWAGDTVYPTVDEFVYERDFSGSGSVTLSFMHWSVTERTFSFSHTKDPDLHEMLQSLIAEIEKDMVVLRKLFP